MAFETPHRLRAALADLLTALGDRRVVVAREITKLHEEVYRGTLSEAQSRFEEPRGEVTLVVEGASDRAPGARDRDEAVSLLARLREGGMRARAAVDLAAEQTGLPRGEVYRLWLDTQG